MRHGGWFTLLLPIFYNDGKHVPGSKFDQTMLELIEQFGGFTYFPEPTFITQGFWKSRGIVYDDHIRIYAVYAEDINTARAYLSAMKPKWKRRFRQEEMLIVEMGVEVL